MIRIGANRFKIMNEGATAFSSQADLKSKAIELANDYCGAGKQNANVIEAAHNEGPFILGKYPQAEP